MDVPCSILHGRLCYDNVLLDLQNNTGKWIYVGFYYMAYAMENNVTKYHRTMDIRCSVLHGRSRGGYMPQNIKRSKNVYFFARI